MISCNWIAVDGATLAPLLCVVAAADSNAFDVGAGDTTPVVLHPSGDTEDTGAPVLDIDLAGAASTRCMVVSNCRNAELYSLDNEQSYLGTMGGKQIGTNTSTMYMCRSDEGIIPPRCSRLRIKLLGRPRHEKDTLRLYKVVVCADKVTSPTPRQEQMSQELPVFAGILARVELFMSSVDQRLSDIERRLLALENASTSTQNVAP